MGIDFNRLVDAAKEKFEDLAYFFRSEDVVDKKLSKEMAAISRRVYETKGPRDSGRQLYMASMIGNRMAEHGIVTHFEKTTEMGNGYQPDLSEPLAFLPKYDDTIELCYKNNRLFTFEMTGNRDPQHRWGNLKCMRIVSPAATDVLATITNDEWNAIVDKIIPAMVEDSKSDEMTVMMTKTDTAYIQHLQTYLAGKTEVTYADIRAEQEAATGPDVIIRGHNMSDQDLENMYQESKREGRLSDADLDRMYNDLLQGQMGKSDALEHRYGSDHQYGG